MKTTKKQFINLIKEITDEVVDEALSAVVPRRPQESVKESSTSLDNYQIESQGDPDKSLLDWAQERLSRESNPNNIDVLEKVIALIQSGDAKKSSREKAADDYPNYRP